MKIYHHLGKVIKCGYSLVEETLFTLRCLSIILSRSRCILSMHFYEKVKQPKLYNKHRKGVTLQKKGAGYFLQCFPPVSPGFSFERDMLIGFCSKLCFVHFSCRFTSRKLSPFDSISENHNLHCGKHKQYIHRR